MLKKYEGALCICSKVVKKQVLTDEVREVSETRLVKLLQAVVETSFFWQGEGGKSQESDLH